MGSSTLDDHASATSQDDGGRLRVGVLGPLHLTVDGVEVEVPGRRRRAVLALLAMAAPDPITVDRLLDAVWTEEAPASGRAALQSHVSRIRRHLGPHADRLTGTGYGYRLELQPDELDAAWAADLLRRARPLAGTDPTAAGGLLRQALDLWRDTPLVDLGEVTDLAGWSGALERSRAEIAGLLVECALATGDVETASSVSADMVAAAPYDEAAVVLQVRALTARGRSREALRAASAFRGRLVGDTGLDPTADLAEVEHLAATGLGTGGGHVVDASPATIAAPALPLLGRHAELAGVTRLLETERLVTLVGPGGVGKTSLALEAAHRLAHTTEGFLVRLEPVEDEDTILDVLARALGLRSDSGDLLDRCIARLHGEDRLLVLDNCEHLLEPVRNLTGRLLESCPSLTVLATSREPLAVPAEQTCRLDPLPLPDPSRPSDLSRSPTVELFMDRARRLVPDVGTGDGELESIARIIRAVDGLPLAIELAAGRLASLALRDVEARMDRALDLLSRGPAPTADGRRHQTLRSAITWSYDLLTDDEQRLFRHLSVFSDGFDLVTAESVARDLGVERDPAAAVAHLVDASMIVADLGPTPRYRMLDSLRRFGLDRLDAEAEVEEASLRLRRWAVELVRWFDVVVETDDEPWADTRLRLELGNLGAAWVAARISDDLDTAAAMIAGVRNALAWRDLTEIARWALELAEDERLAHRPEGSAVLALAAEAAWFSTGDLDRAESLAARACELDRTDGGPGGALGRWVLGVVMLFRGRFDEARDLVMTARQGKRWESEGCALAAMAAAYGGDLDDARRLLSRAKATATAPTFRAWARYVEGEIEGLAGNRREAEAAYRDAIAGVVGTGAYFVAGVASVGLVSSLAAQGRTREALVGYAELIDRWERTGGWTQQWTTLRNLADLLDDVGDDATATLLRDAADRAPEAAAVRRPVVPAPTADRPGSGDAPPDRHEVLARARAAIADGLATVQDRTR